jgi:hypothetical protein
VGKSQKPCDYRACALRGNYTICIQSEDCQTVFAGLRSLMEESDYTAHVHSADALWGAWVPIDNFDAAERLSERLFVIAPDAKHWVRMMVEDETKHVIVFDRTYYPNGEMHEPIPA